MKFTIIARVRDALHMAASMDDSKDFDPYKSQAKKLIRTLDGSSPPRSTIESGDFYFHYLIENAICYLTLTDKRYPKKLAFAYLDELQQEFERSHGREIETTDRPYAFVKFDVTIQRLKKQYIDARTQRNLERLTEDLYDAQAVMTQNIKDVLGRLEKIENVNAISSALSTESRKYLTSTRRLNRFALLKKYWPFILLIFVILFVLYRIM